MTFGCDYAMVFHEPTQSSPQINELLLLSECKKHGTLKVKVKNTSITIHSFWTKLRTPLNST